jgi:hypothetical protein
MDVHLCLQLDCTNDSTVCFRPTAGENMEFVFRYGPEIGLGPDDDVRFRVMDKDGNRVYEQPLRIPYTIHIDDPFGGPGFPAPDTMRLFWDGRINFGLFSGHLADPALDSYRAIVQVLDGQGNPDMETNAETFDVVPTIDSVLVTHYPHFPPPSSDENIDIYSIIKGKIDDSGQNSIDYKYYKPEGNFQEVIAIWNGQTFEFWDRPSDRQQKYYEDSDSRLVDLLSWTGDKYGAIEYKWYVIHDYRDYIEGVRQRIIYSDEKDTTSNWGNSWKASISAPSYWMEAQLQPYMRLLTFSEVVNKKNEFKLQDKKSATGAAAHKVFLSEYNQVYERDIVYWAVSHIGVPYYILDGLNKIPYKKIECSGLVTSCRIQQIGPNTNHNYRIGYITAKNYLIGGYWYNGWHLTETEQVPATDPGISRGCLVSFRRHNHASNVSKHIAIIEDVDIDFLHETVTCCRIIHAYGENGPIDGRVRYDDMFEKLPPDRYYYTYLRWTR